MKLLSAISVQILFCLVLFFCEENRVNGQNNNFKTYGLSEGLSRSNVYSLMQDTRGYLWVGTDGGGVNKFNGSTFINYTKKDGFSGNTIRSILEDSKTNLFT